MFIDLDNFEQHKQTIIDQIKRCDFLGFDLELTGIKGDYQDIFEELPFERYLKARKVSMKYNIIQFGLCIFIKKQKGYVAYPYTFFLFPQDLDDFVGLQVGAIFFNSEHGMDWNRWINKGIGYINRAQYQKLQDDYNKDFQQLDQEELKNQFEKILDDVKAIDKKTIQDLIDKLEKFNISEDKQTTIETTNGYQRKIIYTYLEAYQKNMIGESLLKGEMKITKLTNAEKQVKEEEKQQLKINRFQTKTGFYQIWECILNSKKYMVGHNCFADLLFCYSHFVQCPPISWEEFKEDIHRNWPPIYDTKYIIQSAQPLEKIRGKLETSTSIENLAEFIKNNMNYTQIEVEQDQNLYHTAGFDAYMTGFIFINLTKDFTQQELQNQKNKLNQFKSNYNINLNTAEDIKLTQKNIIYIKFPEDDRKNLQIQKNQRLQLQKSIVDNIINTLKQQYNLAAYRIIHYRYIYIEFNQEYDLKQIQNKLSKVPDFQDCQIFNEKQYEKDRREFKEKEAKLEKFDKRQ
ncbi:unnamed protein product [Paramecium primaurelia]|uniref:Uncharacterized protein n=1 Tax=Paramecium primaurelia TaxID=5886 RepID=A0A8S1MU49_PARPR|nr:unnamed protein product [Paramecium primaurelia]